MDKTEKRRKIKEKDIERLEFECLMRSDKFQAVWEWALACKRNRNRKIRVPIPEQLKHSGIISIFLKHKEFLCMNPENASFDKYCSLKNEYLEELRNSGELPAALKTVEDYKSIILQDIDIAANRIRKMQNHEPSVSELKDSLINWWMSDFHVYLKITQRKFTFKELVEIENEIHNILKKRIPRKRLVKEEMERYLKVYDSRINKGGKHMKKYKEVCRELYPNADFADKRLELSTDFKNAKRMIERVEKGLPL
jgi:hypothetical protein